MAAGAQNYRPEWRFPRDVLVKFGRGYTLDWRTGCWVWNNCSRDFYGQFRMVSGAKHAHRASWIIHRGPIPKGLVVCHTCDVRPCVNPDHLFLGTQQDNIADMVRKGRHYAAPKKTHCKLGHEFTEENTFIKENGAKGCKRCRSDNQLRYKARNLDAVRKYQRERARRIRESR